MPLCDVDNLFVNLDNTSAYWLGFLWADGYNNYQPNKNRYHVKLNLSYIDLEHLQKFRDYIDTDKKLYHRKSNNSYSFEIFNQKLSTNLKNMGIISYRDFNATNLPNIDDKFFSHFLRGFFDGDGTIGMYKILDKRVNITYQRIQLKITTPNEKIAQHIHNILFDNQIFSAITKERTRKIYHVVINGYRNMLKFFDYIYKDSNENNRLARKYNKGLEVVEYITTHKRKYIKPRVTDGRNRDSRKTKIG